MKFRLPRKIKYFRKARHWHGHGIHSPFLFYLVTKVIEDKKQYLAYRILRSHKKEILNRIKDIEGLVYQDNTIQYSGSKQLFKNVELGYRYGKLLLRLVNEFKPSSVIFYGPTFGMNLLYLALANENIPVYCCNKDFQLQEFCRCTLKKVPAGNISFQSEEAIVTKIQEFVFINLSFDSDEVKRIAQLKLSLVGEDDVMVLRGIHKSRAMEALWKDLIKDRKIRISLDLYEIGILLFRRKLQKQDFVLRF